MLCNRCGQRAPEGATRCSRCGNRVGSPSVDVQIAWAQEEPSMEKEQRMSTATGPASRPEVMVTDIRMPFWSMVIFMVKWAIVSIPAILILVVLTVVFWTTIVGLVGSLGSSRVRSVSTQTAATGNGSPQAGQQHADEIAYLSRVEVRNVSVGRSVLGGDGAFGEVKNLGDHTLKDVEITIYCLGKDGKPIFEKAHNPVRVSTFNTDGPLKPGYSRQFGVKLDDAPSDWAKKVDIKVSKVEFQ
jgi:hypothetical protein